jgi:hypothetical protein
MLIEGREMILASHCIVYYGQVTLLSSKYAAVVVVTCFSINIMMMYFFLSHTCAVFVYKYGNA